MERESSVPGHESISFTAKLVAYGRRFSDIPFAREVAEQVDAQRVFLELLDETGVEPQELGWVAPLVEARYKCINEAIRRAGLTQVLEFASGVSLRGLAMTRDPGITYVETDLPGISREKKALVARIRADRDLPDQGNLFFHDVNILRWEEIEPALAHFDPAKPVAVIHEGLFQYLSMDEKEEAARNVHRILERFGGLWITPDLNTRAESKDSPLRQGAMAKVVEKISGATHRGFEERAFADDFAVEDFMGRLGFRMRVVPQVDGSFELSSAEHLHMPADRLREMKSALKLWEMSLAPRA